MTDDTLIYFGGECKALGDGKVGGYLVRFGTPETADVQGDYFTAATDYGLDVSVKTRTVYQHGIPRAHDDLSRVLKGRRIGVGTLSVVSDGVVIEAQLDTSKEPVRRVYERAVKGELGWSSGSVERLVERNEIKGKFEVVSWPIVEASLTPTPVEPRNRAYALKSLFDDGDAPESLIKTGADLVAAIERFPHLSTAKRAAIKAWGDALLAKWRATQPKADPERVRLLRLSLLQEDILT